jgi:two-component system chemotaxis response regulator CheY
VRVLIAHESQAARDALVDAVRRGGDEPLEIVTASEGSETLELLLQDDPPDVALVDWDLPAIEGPEMCRLVRDFQHGHDTWLVVLAASRHTDTSDAWRAGAAACISTPASPAALRACVDEGLRKMRAPRASGPVAVGEIVAGEEMAAAEDVGAAEHIAGDADPSLDAASMFLRAVGPTADDDSPGCADSGSATLDAVRLPEGNSDFYGFGGSALRATAEPDHGVASIARAEHPEPDEPRGAALLQAVLSER